LNKQIKIDLDWIIKYPFTEEAREYIRINVPPLEEFTEDELINIMDYAFKKIQTILVGHDWSEWTKELEMMSYPLGFALIKATNNSALWRSFADKERKRIQLKLGKEDINSIIYIAKNTFNLRVKYENNSFLIHFLDYLSISNKFASERWKLVNRKIELGYVTLEKNSVNRIIAEYVRFSILDKMKQPSSFPPIIQKYVPKLNEYVKKNRIIREKPIELINSVKNRNDLPPCMKEIYDDAFKGENLAHASRFSIATFLISSNWNADQVQHLFSFAPDFNPKMTKYQVEHLAGLRGGRTKYKSPSCKWMRTFNICREDETCKGIINPLQWKTKQWRTRKNIK